MQKSVHRFVWFAALCVVAALAWTPPVAGAERKKEPLPEAPPPAQPLTVQVRRGERIEIPLRIYGQKNEPLKYLVRAAPAHGKLTAPRVAGREVSTVIYTPPADLAVTRDRFTYAVQSSAGVSAAVEVGIAIVDQPPDLALPGAIDFPPMLAGATAVKSLEISNRGGGLAEGRVEVEVPWKIDGTPKYRLGAGARAVFKVVFAPVQGGRFESAVRFSSQPETSVPVRGEALEAMAATPAKIVLQNAVGDAVRTGIFELSNQTDEERRVTLSGGARLQVPTELSVPARGKVSVPVQTAAGDVAELEGEVRVEAAGLTVRVAVRAARVGALVRAVGGPVAFGRVDATKAAGASFELENFGGSAATVSWEIGAPFVVAQASVMLSPGEKKTLAMRTQPAAPGKYRAWLTVKADQQKLEIPVEAELLAKSVADASRGAGVGTGQPPAVEAPSSTPEPVAPVPALAIDPDFQVDLLRPSGVGLTRLEATRLTLEWPVALSVAAKFRFESRQIFADPSGALRVRWDELPLATVRREGDRNVAVISGLPPGKASGVRVVPLGPTGEAGKPLFTQYFITPAKANWWPRFTPLRALFVLLVVCAGFILRQRRKAR